jgi:hypothetical protein
MIIDFKYNSKKIQSVKHLILIQILPCNKIHNNFCIYRKITQTYIGKNL